MSQPVLFIIYSCKTRFHLSEALYERLNHRLPQAKVLLMYGDPTLKEEYKVIDDKYLVLRVGDYYEHLADKTIMLIKACINLYPDIQGIIKCDDDIVPCIPSIHQNIQIFLENNINYAGNIMYNSDLRLSWHVGKTHDRKFDTEKQMAKPCNFADGPMYWMNKEVLSYLYHMIETKKLEYMFNEDVMIGYNLNQANIYPQCADLFTNDVSLRDTISFQNINNRYHFTEDV